VKHQRRCRSTPYRSLLLPYHARPFPATFVHTEHWSFDSAICLLLQPFAPLPASRNLRQISNPPLGIVTTIIRHIYSSPLLHSPPTWSTPLPTGVQPMWSLHAPPWTQRKALPGTLSAQVLAAHMVFLMPYPSRGSSTEGPVP
jgi:hypothetical protein